ELEPLTTLASIASHTEHIGLIGTATTTYNEPYHVARKFASLDLISEGRAAWNLVTTDLADEARNFHQAEHLIHKERYARAEEFYDVVMGLWKSWEQDALIRDQASGIFFDPAKLHRLNHVGECFSVQGPLNVTPSPQGHPLIVQAGSSERGRDLAARTANIIFTAQADFASAKAFYEDVKNRLKNYGREANELSILPGLYVIVAKTQAEAEQKQQELDALIQKDIGLGLLGRMMGNFDLSHLDVDAPLPDLPVTETGQQSRQQLFIDLAKQNNWTIRQLYQRVAGGRGHFSLVGTPEKIADEIEFWFNNGAADGFNIMPALLADGVKDFVSLVVPLLQQKGIFRSEYQGTTLSAHYGVTV
ncbi:MAG: LLM class flavin-dependent oxidoreductase, partial [Acinetobacter sp.]